VGSPCLQGLSLPPGRLLGSAAALPWGVPMQDATAGLPALTRLTSLSLLHQPLSLADIANVSACSGLKVRGVVVVGGGGGGGGGGGPPPQRARARQPAAENPGALPALMAACSPPPPWMSRAAPQHLALSWTAPRPLQPAHFSAFEGLTTRLARLRSLHLTMCDSHAPNTRLSAANQNYSLAPLAPSLTALELAGCASQRLAMSVGELSQLARLRLADAGAPPKLCPALLDAGMPLPAPARCPSILPLSVHLCRRLSMHGKPRCCAPASQVALPRPPCCPAQPPGPPPPPPPPPGGPK